MNSVSTVLSVNYEEMLVWMSYLMIVAALGVFVLANFQPAPYGRYSRVQWLPLASQYTLGARLAWFVQESPAFLVPILVWGYSSSSPNFVNKVFLVLFLMHYFHRTFFFSVLIRSGNTVHLSVHLLALIFCIYNGFLQSQYLLINNYPDEWMYSWKCIVGVLLFFGGMFVNIHSDHILRNLRKPGETGYKIPKGGIFEYVSGANYFGESVEWTGYAIACWSLPAFAFALFTVCNVGPRAINHHRWYLEKFKDYPHKRKAFIPYIL